jgi:hypothetical protein
LLSFAACFEGWGRIDVFLNQANVKASRIVEFSFGSLADLEVSPLQLIHDGLPNGQVLA